MSAQKTIPTPFTIDIPQDRLDKIASRVADYEWHEMPQNGGWAYGANLDYMKDLCAYWLDGFSWRKAETGLNRFPQFKAPVTIDGQTLNLHYIYEKGSGSNPQPLIIIHGWPGSFYEFMEVIEPLAHPERFGGDAEDGFDVIVPSLPGYGFSDKPANPIGPMTAAKYMNGLMTDVLGYDSYLAQGGDWGAMTTCYLGKDHAPCEAIHLNMMGFSPPAPEGDMSDEEQQWRDGQRLTFEMEGAYFRLQMTKPQSLSYAMMDSPVGVAAWLVEKFNTWSHTPEDNIDNAYSKDQLLTNIMIYLVTRTFNTASWMYRGLMEEGGAGLPKGNRIEVPVGVANFPHDPLITWPKREWAERAYNVQHWTDMELGGHFAALEQPNLYIADVRQFFSGLRSED